MDRVTGRVHDISDVSARAQHGGEPASVIRHSRSRFLGGRASPRWCSGVCGFSRSSSSGARQRRRRQVLLAHRLTRDELSGRRQGKALEQGARQSPRGKSVQGRSPRRLLGSSRTLGGDGRAGLLDGGLGDQLGSGDVDSESDRRLAAGASEGGRARVLRSSFLGAFESASPSKGCRRRIRDSENLRVGARLPTRLKPGLRGSTASGLAAQPPTGLQRSAEARLSKRPCLGSDRGLSPAPTREVLDGKVFWQAHHLEERGDQLASASGSIRVHVLPDDLP